MFLTINSSNSKPSFGSVLKLVDGFSIKPYSEEAVRKAFEGIVEPYQMEEFRKGVEKFSSHLGTDGMEDTLTVALQPHRDEVRMLVVIKDIKSSIESRLPISPIRSLGERLTSCFRQLKSGVSNSSVGLF